MEQIVGRRLERLEYVHHRNLNKKDNDPSNLEVMDPKSDSILHNQKHPLTKECVVCGTVFTPKPAKRAIKKTCSRQCANTLIADARTKLTDQQKDELRERYPALTQTQLAAEYGISQAQVWAIIHRKDRRG